MYTSQNQYILYHPINAILTDYGSKQAPQTGNVPISQVKFDPQKELAWSANVLGHTTSYFSDALTKYTSFSIGNNEPLLQISPQPRGILCLLKDELKMRLRRGVPLFSYSSPSFKNINCMSPSTTNHDRAIFGGESSLIELNLERQKQVRGMALTGGESGCFQMRTKNKFICCASKDGQVTVRDCDTFRVIYTFKTHTGQILDFDIQNNYLITCGTSSTHQRPDKCLMLYDLRTGRYVRPIITNLPFSLLRFSPVFPSSLLAVSDTGSYMVIDINEHLPLVTSEFQNQVSLPPEGSITSMDISSSGQSVLFGDNSGVMHLLGTNSSITFNQNSEMTEFADPLESLPLLPPHDNVTPLSTIPNMYSNSLTADLSSNSIKKYETENRFEIPPIDPRILDTVVKRSDVGYAQNPYRRYGTTGYIRGAVKLIKQNSD